MVISFRVAASELPPKKGMIFYATVAVFNKHLIYAANLFAYYMEGMQLLIKDK